MEPSYHTETSSRAASFHSIKIEPISSSEHNSSSTTKQWKNHHQSPARSRKGRRQVGTHQPRATPSLYSNRKDHAKRSSLDSLSIAQDRAFDNHRQSHLLGSSSTHSSAYHSHNLNKTKSVPGYQFDLELKRSGGASQALSSLGDESILVGSANGGTRRRPTFGGDFSSFQNHPPSVSKSSSSRQKRPFMSKEENYIKQRQFWQLRVLKESVEHGASSLPVAQMLMHLGEAQLNLNQYEPALASYQSALQVFTAVHGDNHVSVAKSLDKIGFAQCRTHQNLDFALKCLQEAYQIRKEELGQDHVDTVDTLNNLAGVYLNMGSFEKATRDYLLVLDYRLAIFGHDHPSVAVTSFTVGSILMQFMDKPERAEKYLKFSLGVYEKLGLGKSKEAQETRQMLWSGPSSTNSTSTSPSSVIRHRRGNSLDSGASSSHSEKLRSLLCYSSSKAGF